MRSWLRRYGWPTVGVAAVLFSVWLLYHELRGTSPDDVVASLGAISTRAWLLAVAATLVAYVALAWYDRIALLHLRRHVPWLFITLCSFSAYALAHNLGASVLSGAVVRYRAYRTQGLTPAEIGILIGLCAFTFALGVVIISGALLVVRPDILDRFGHAPEWVGMTTGVVMLSAVALYVLGSWLHLRPLSVGGLHIHYPRLPIVRRQLVIAPAEIAAAAAIIYFALPPADNPGYLVVLGIFAASFSAALLSHAPGGLGVLEIMFVSALPEVDPADVLAALIVFRLLYLLVPLAISLVVVLVFERAQLRQARLRRTGAAIAAGRHAEERPPSGRG